MESTQTEDAFFGDNGFAVVEEKGMDRNSRKFNVEDTDNGISELESVDTTKIHTKIHRTRFTAFQKKGLEEAFSSNHYIRSRDCQTIAARLGLPSKTVKVWFKNKRFKTRKIVRQEEQYQKNQSILSISSSFYPNDKFQEFLLQQTQQLNSLMASLPSYTNMDDRILSLSLYPTTPYFKDEYLMPTCYSPSLATMQPHFMHQPHPYM